MPTAAVLLALAFIGYVGALNIFAGSPYGYEGLEGTHGGSNTDKLTMIGCKNGMCCPGTLTCCLKDSCCRGNQKRRRTVPCAKFAKKL